MMAAAKSKAPAWTKLFAGLGWMAALSAFTYFNAADNITRALAGDEMARRMAIVQIGFGFMLAISGKMAQSRWLNVGMSVLLISVNVYSAYVGASHRNDGVKTSGTNRTLVEQELREKREARRALGSFDLVSEAQIASATHKRDETAAARCTWGCKAATKTARDKAADTAQEALDKLLAARTRTAQAEKLDTRIAQLEDELRRFTVSANADNGLAKLGGVKAEDTENIVSLLIAACVELGNKFGPGWTYGFVLMVLGSLFGFVAVADKVSAEAAPASRVSTPVSAAKPKLRIASFFAGVLAKRKEAESVISYAPGSAREFHRRYLEASGNPNDKIRAGDIQKRYAEDCARVRVEPLDQKVFSQALQALVQYGKTKGGRPYYYGVKWRDVPLPVTLQKAPRVVVDNTVSNAAAAWG